MDIKRPKIVRNIKFLHVSASGRHLQGIKSTRYLQYEKNNLSILLMKCELLNSFYQHNTKYVVLVLAKLCTVKPA